MGLLFVFLSGCASNPLDSIFDPIPAAALSQDPIVRVLDGGRLRLTLQVMEQEKIKRELGIDLNARRIRGIWVEIENQSDRPYWLLRSSLDGDYYPISEILYSLRGEMDEGQLKTLQGELRSKGFRNPIRAHSKADGYVFISSNHLNRVARLVLQGTNGAWEVPIFLPVPELKGYRFPKQLELYAAEEIISTDADGLRKLLGTLPCCTTDAGGEKKGDPLNLVLVGEASDLHYAFSARQWHTVEKNYLQSAKKTVQSFLFGDRYPYSPVSPLYVFGRKQDYALQKARSNITQRNHLRLWLSPWRVDGKPVWVGQVSRDIGVHFTTESPIFFTHKIDPDVDEDRNYLLEDLILTQQVTRIGYVSGLGASSESQPRTNLTGDTYYTDGLRAVVFLGSHKEATFLRAGNNMKILDWDHTPKARKARHIDEFR